MAVQQQVPVASPAMPVDQAAWARFRELIMQGGGVVDHPARAREGMRPSDRFAAFEIDLVEHHRRNSIPLLVGDCRLAGCTVLELGAGTGGLAVALALAGVRSVTAIEPVPLNLAAGAWRARAYGVGRTVRFVHVSDTTHLPFSNDVFDAAICSSVLQYIPDIDQRRQLLQELARAVRPGGLVVVQATGNGLYPGGPHSSGLLSNAMPRRAARLGQDRGITYWEVRRALGPLGFDVVSQDGAAIGRWRARNGSRSWRDRRKWGVNVASGIAVVASKLTRAPVEAFLPFPELVFRKRAGSY